MADIGIQTSLHGIGVNGFGITRDGDLVSKNRVIAPRSNKYIRMFDDFHGDTLNSDLYSTDVGSDGACVAAAINAQIGGVARLVAGAGAGADAAANLSLIRNQLQWKAANGGLYMEARIKIDAITAVALYVGFTDDISTNDEFPVTLSGTTFTTNASDAVGFLFDTAATTDTIRLVGVKGNTDATHQDTSQAPVAATFITLRVEIGSDEIANFFIDDLPVGTQMTGALTKTVALSPVIGVFSREAVIKNLDIDYIDVGMHRV